MLVANTSSEASAEVHNTAAMVRMRPPQVVPPRPASWGSAPAAMALRALNELGPMYRLATASDCSIHSNKAAVVVGSSIVPAARYAFIR